MKIPLIWKIRAKLVEIIKLFTGHEYGCCDNAFKCCSNCEYLNGDKLDICAENLERVTHSENVKRAYKTGLMKKQCGEDHHAHKLTAKDVEYIRSVYSKRDPHYGAVALSKKFGVDRTTIHDIVN